MYPHIYYHSFLQLTTGTEVFVAMPMGDDAFNPVWTEVFQPAITGVGLAPYRVDTPRTGDSLIIALLTGVRRARLVLADISPDARSGEMPNSNVMYELGLAQAVRLPETVIVVRRRDARIPFDVSHLRVLSYDGQSHVAAREQVASYLTEGLRHANQTRNEVLEQLWALLDPPCRDVVALEWFGASGRALEVARAHGEAYDYGDTSQGHIKYHAGNVSYGRWKDDELRSAFHRLLSLGVLTPVEERWDLRGREYPSVHYRFTRLGEEVAQRFTSVSRE